MKETERLRLLYQDSEAFKVGIEVGRKDIIEKACVYAEARYDLDYCGNVNDVLNYLKSLVED